MKVSITKLSKTKRNTAIPNITHIPVSKMCSVGNDRITASLGESATDSIQRGYFKRAGNVRMRVHVLSRSVKDVMCKGDIHTSIIILLQLGLE